MRPSTLLLFTGILSWTIASYEGIRNTGSWNLVAAWFIIGGILIFLGQNQRKKEK